MPITYSYDPDANVVYASAVGVVTAEELKEYFEKVQADETIAHMFWEVVKIDEVRNVTLNYKDCVALSALVKRFIKEKGYQGALMYSPRTLHYLAAKLFFSVPSISLPATFLVTSNKKEFQNMLYKYLELK